MQRELERRVTISDTLMLECTLAMVQHACVGRPAPAQHVATGSQKDSAARCLKQSQPVPGPTLGKKAASAAKAS